MWQSCITVAKNFEYNVEYMHWIIKLVLFCCRLLNYEYSWKGELVVESFIRKFWSVVRQGWSLRAWLSVVCWNSLALVLKTQSVPIQTNWWSSMAPRNRICISPAIHVLKNVMILVLDRFWEIWTVTHLPMLCWHILLSMLKDLHV